MFKMTRRDILKALSAAGVYGAAPFLPSRMVFAATPQAQPILVVLHLRGGCDGLNLVSPANDPDFIAARASELRVEADGSTPGYALANGPAPGIDFRLHNLAGGLAELYKQGHLALIHACGLTDQTRSHFVATDIIERGGASETDITRLDTGWLARLIKAQSGASPLQAVAVSGGMSGDLDGLEHALAVPDINGGLPYVGGPAVSTALWSMYSGTQGPVGEAGRLALQLPVVIDQKINRDIQGHVIPYQPENGANYDAAGGFAGTLKSVARLIKMDIGLRAITLDYGGWDMHEYQAGRFRNLVGPLSSGMAAFWNDIAAWQDRVVVVTVTEFGRRLRSNKSNGTDHGRAGVMAVLGGKVQGGKFYGSWPGLTSDKLEEGVDLAVTTDYRQVLSETAAYVSGRENTEIFPGYTSPGKLGLF
jgi:uncharacterized protein (DUF1501 family)